MLLIPLNENGLDIGTTRSGTQNYYS